MTKIERVIAAARVYGVDNHGIGSATDLRIVGLPMHRGDGCERWLVRASGPHDLLLVDVEVSSTGDVHARSYVF